MRHVTALARMVHRDQGVGFWSRADAENHARLEQERTGGDADLYSVSSPMGTHDLWFVRVSQRAVA